MPTSSIPQDDIVRLARLYGRSRPGTIRAGIGPQQTASGETFARSLSALAIISGHWRHRGGGFFIEAYPTLDNSAPEAPELSPEGWISICR